MKKRTIAIVSITLVLAFLAVAVIATFPTYLFEDKPQDNTSAPVQSDSIVEGEGEPGVDIGVMGGGEGGAQAVLPTINDEELGYSETPESELSVIAEANNTKVLAETGAFDSETKVRIKKLGILDKDYYRARHYLDGIANKFTAFELIAKKDGETVLPNALVKLSFTIPEDYDSSKVAVYYLLSDGGVEEVTSEISKDSKTLSVKISQVGVYILVEKEPKTENDTSSGDTSSDNISTESDKTDSNVSSSTPEDTSSDTSSDVFSDSSSDSSSDTSSEDENKDTMDGWTPWY